MVNGKLSRPVGGSGDDFSDPIPDGFSRGPDGQLYPKSKTAISGLRPAAKIDDSDDEEPGCESEVVATCALFREGITDAGRYVEFRIPTERPFESVEESVALPVRKASFQADFSDPKEIAILMNEARIKLGLPEPPVFEDNDRPTRPDISIMHLRGYREDAFEKITALETLYGFECQWWKSGSAMERLWGQLNYLSHRVFTDEKIMSDIIEALGYAYLDVVQGEDGNHSYILPRKLHDLINVMIEERYDGDKLLAVIKKTR